MSAALPLAEKVRLDVPFALRGRGSGLFTSRETGNLSLAAGAGHERGLATRQRLCDELRLDWLCASPQVHGREVKRVRELEARGAAPRALPADGHATALRRIGTMVLAADCVPVILAVDGAVAAIHAGWRGLADGVLEEGVAALAEVCCEAERGEAERGEAERGDGLWGAGGTSGEAVAVIGPCAGACCYEVGAEVLSRFAADLGGDVPGGARGDGGSAEEAAGARGWREGAARADRGGDREAKLDLRSIAERRLLAAGVRHVAHLEICTICDERMFSHRREGVAAGRHAGIAWLR